MSINFLVGGHGRRNVSADLQMVAHYAAEVARRDNGNNSHHVQSSHSPDNYRHPTSNGNSVISCNFHQRWESNLQI